MLEGSGKWYLAAEVSGQAGSAGSQTRIGHSPGPVKTSQWLAVFENCIEKKKDDQGNPLAAKRGAQSVKAEAEPSEAAEDGYYESKNREKSKRD